MTHMLQERVTAGD